MPGTSSKTIRVLAAGSLGILAANYLYSNSVDSSVDEVTAELLSFNGLNAVVFLPAWFFDFYYAVQVVSLGLLVAGIRFAKAVFAVNVIASTLLWSLTGIAISMPLEVVLGTALAYAYGAICILIFSSAKERSGLT